MLGSGGDKKTRIRVCSVVQCAAVCSSMHCAVCAVLCSVCSMHYALCSIMQRAPLWFLGRPACSAPTWSRASALTASTTGFTITCSGPIGADADTRRVTQSQAEMTSDDHDTARRRKMIATGDDDMIMIWQIVVLRKPRIQTVSFMFLWFARELFVERKTVSVSHQILSRKKKMLTNDQSDHFARAKELLFADKQSNGGGQHRNKQ